jgi:hypothetical protein
MNIQQRKALLVQLGKYMKAEDPGWIRAKEKATAENPWFTPEFIDHAIKNIVEIFLLPASLDTFIHHYQLENEPLTSKNIGIVMAGNIPLVGFHDWLCVFLSGHKARIKPSSKDTALITHITEVIKEFNPAADPYINISERIPSCDAYIATGSNNSSRYFEYYFAKYPSLIRKNRTSVAILDGKETVSDLAKLADDVFLYFGLGCRNVTQLFVPENYDFVPLLDAFRKYQYLSEHHKFRNNYDYNMAVHILNNEYYMTNEVVILIRNASPFSRISELHYQYYTDEKSLIERLQMDLQIQCIAGKNFIPFGRTQAPGIFDFADGVDTMKFLKEL